MKKLLLPLLLMLSCSGYLDNDCITISNVENDEYNITAKYYMTIKYFNPWLNKRIVYFVDTVNAYKVNDTILISSLRRK